MPILVYQGAIITFFLFFYFSFLLVSGLCNVVFLSLPGLNGIEIERTEVMTMLLSLSAYSHPKEIALPTGYVVVCALVIDNMCAANVFVQ